MIPYAKKLIQSKFIRNVTIVATGTAAAQAIAMIFMPIITRLYGPEAYGILGTFTAVLAILAPLAALSYPIAIVLPKSDKEAIGVAKLSLSIAVPISLVVALILLVFKEPLVNVFSLQAVASYLLLLPLAMLSSVAMMVMNQWVIRKRLFKMKAKVAVFQALWINGAKVGIGLFWPFAVGLIILTTLGSALYALMLWVGVKASNDRAPASNKTESLPAPSLRQLASVNRDFACYRTPQVILNAASESMPVLCLASFFGPAEAGFYALARMVLGVPSGLIGQSVADVFYPKFVEILHKGENGRSILLKSCLALVGVGVVPYLAIFILGPVLFGFVFGGEWHDAGELARWMSIWLLAVLSTRPIIAAIPALRLQRQFLFFEIVSLILRAGSMFIGCVYLSSAGVVIAIYSSVSVLVYVWLFLFVTSRA